MTRAESVERELARLKDQASKEPGVAELLALHEAMEEAEGLMAEATSTYMIVTSDSTNGVAFVSK